MKIIARDRHDPLVIAVAREHLTAEREEAWIWQAIIFEENGLLNLFEGPGDAAADTPAAAHIGLRIVAPHLTGPVHRFDDSAGFGAKLVLTGTPGAGCVGDNQQLPGTGLAYGRKGAGGDVRAIENQEDDGRSHSLGDPLGD